MKTIQTGTDLHHATLQICVWILTVGVKMIVHPLLRRQLQCLRVLPGLSTTSLRILSFPCQSDKHRLNLNIHFLIDSGMVFCYELYRSSRTYSNYQLCLSLFMMLCREYVFVPLIPKRKRFPAPSMSGSQLTRRAADAWSHRGGPFHDGNTVADCQEAKQDPITKARNVTHTRSPVSISIIIYSPKFVTYI